MLDKPIKKMTVVALIGLFAFFSLNSDTSASGTNNKSTSENGKSTSKKTTKKCGTFCVRLPDGHPKYAIGKIAPKKYKKWAEKHDSRFVTPYEELKEANHKNQLPRGFKLHDKKKSQDNGR